MWRFVQENPDISAIATAARFNVTRERIYQIRRTLKQEEGG